MCLDVNNPKNHKKQENVAYIYGLMDPGTNDIRYVGKSILPFRRYFEHHRFVPVEDNSYRANWIRSLLKKEQQPDLCVIEKCSDTNWDEVETFWIKTLKEQGYNLVNTGLGGVGGDRMSGRKRTPEQCLAISLRQKGQKRGPLSESRKKKIGDSNRGKTKPAGFGEAVRARQLGRKLPQWWCDKMSAARLGVKLKKRTENSGAQ